MILGYNTNGFAHHWLKTAVEIIAELGYGGVAVTPDYGALYPHVERYDEPDYALRVRCFDIWLQALKLSSVVETGARFALDARRKHQPTLISPDPDDRGRRFDWLLDCLDAAVGLHSTALSFWSGTPTDDVTASEHMARLVDGCKKLADIAAERNVRLAFEPEPGMFIDTMDKFAELHARVNHPSFGLTLDVGHLVCMNELSISKHIHQWKHCLWNLHLDDMKKGVHDHLMFGEGEVDFSDVFNALKAIEYQGMASVELSRHSYDAVNVATKSMQFLKRFV